MNQNSTIAATFQQLRQGKRIGLMPFIPAGYPDLETTAAVLPALQEAGADLIEVGIPFSDPIADGPIIQQAFTEALAKKVKLADVLRCIAALRGKVTIPLVAMLSYSIIYRHGLERFVKEAKEAGFAGLIVPDLPPPEAQAVTQVIRAGGLDTVLLVAPTTEPARRAEIASLCSGFVYYLSVSGTTGQRDQLPADLQRNVLEMRKLSSVPVCVGFGISTAAHVAQLSGVADGAIVGSAIVKRMQEHAAEGSSRIAAAAGEFCRQLRGQ